MPAPNDTDVFDVLFDFSGGMNSDLQPLLLEKNQAAMIVNGTVRGNFLTDRPKYRKIEFEFQEAQAKTIFAQTTADFTNPPRGETVSIHIDTAFTGSIDDQIRVGVGEGAAYRVLEIQAAGLTLVVVNISGLPASVFFAGSDVFTPAIAATSAADFQGTLWQGGTYYKPDFGNESLVVAIAGRLFDVEPDPVAATAIVSDVTIPGDPNPADRTQAWLWQAEKWVIWNDGLSIPVFYDGTSSVRSSYQVGPQSIGVLTSAITLVTPIGPTAIVASLSINPTGIVNIGDTVFIPSNFPSPLILTVTAVGASSVTGTNTNINASASNVFIFGIGLPVSYQSPSFTQLPPGRMGVYGMGRNWVCLTDGKQFVASDLVGGSSGTTAENFRDAVLKITENEYLAGGGNFTVPGSVGDIRFMRFTATLDSSLGQGALQVGTPNGIFSCNAPVDRLTWQNLQNPILTQSLITFGGLGQDSTVNVNGDLYFRSIDGIRSLLLGRRGFDQPGNVPQSVEMNRILEQDDTSLLQYGSAIVFENRLYMTTKPTPSDEGVYHQGLIAENFDPISSLRGKAAPVYDGLHTGLNVLQLLRGQFSGVERAFAFCLNTTTSTIELWEILRDNAAFADDGVIPVTWSMESSAIFANVQRKTLFDAIRMLDGEIYIDDLRSRANIRVQYRPGGYPCWIPWTNFSICSATDTQNDSTSKPGYRNRIGFDEPSGADCDEVNNVPFRESHWFQVKITIQGHLRILALRFRGCQIPIPRFARVAGCCAGEEILH